MPAVLRRRINALSAESRFWRNDIRWFFSTEAMRRRRIELRLNPAHNQWLFILGVNNSGTTLLSRLLGLHPQIHELPMEGQWLTRGLPRPLQLGVRRLWTQRLDAFRWTEQSDPGPALRCKFDWASHYPPGSGCLLEKSPPDMVRSLWLAANFQPCRFIVLLRHPYAVCEGIRRREGCTIEEAAAHWKAAHEILLRDLPHLKHALRLTYEQLCDDTTSVLRSIEAFVTLDEPFDRTAAAHEFDVHNIDEQPALVQNMNQRSMERLSAEDKAVITRIAGPVMELFGYTPMD